MLDGEAARRASGSGEQNMAAAIDAHSARGRYSGTCGENKRGETWPKHDYLL
jgi:hypothetical protein